MWKAINENIEDMNSRRAAWNKLNWKNIHNRYREDLNRETSDYGMGTLQMLGHRFPDHFKLMYNLRDIKVESSRTEIFDFAEDANTLELHYYLITEQLLLIDSIEDRLLLAKKELMEIFLKGETVTNTFTINLNDNYDIVEYLKLKSGN